LLDKCNNIFFQEICSASNEEHPNHACWALSMMIKPTRQGSKRFPSHCSHGPVGPIISSKYSYPPRREAAKPHTPTDPYLCHASVYRTSDSATRLSLAQNESKPSISFTLLPFIFYFLLFPFSDSISISLADTQRERERERIRVSSLDSSMDGAFVLGSENCVDGGNEDIVALILSFTS
jgi:hypothetical protein